ncbi:MAG: YcxB family protein [Lachnospiraceae bacterium]|nr:YcxB family protein [Lachnospiraceae bacterium]MEE0861379.1 YcxB family protein [Lachnospiraceae bacterium]
MEVKASVQLTTKQLYEFLMRHTYFCFGGVVGLLLSIGGFTGFALVVNEENISAAYLGVLFGIGLLFTVIQPLIVFRNAKKQSRAYKKYPLEYTISERGIEVKQDDAEGSNTWENVMKIVSTKRLVIIYTSKVHAYVIPRAALEGSMEEFKELVKTHCHASYINI